MLTALRQSDLVKCIASDTDKSHKPFLCPECKCEVVLRQGKIKTPHFAHKPPVTCQYGIGESEYHRQCKEILYRQLSQYNELECELEKRLEYVRPDVYIRSKQTQKQYAIEVQISNLPLDQIIYRTQQYERLGIYVLWLPSLNETRLSRPDDRYSPRIWEKWLHALYFGRVYYWKDGLTITPVHFGEYTTYVEYSSWYDESGYEVSAGGYNKTSKRYRTPIFGKPVKFPESFNSLVRDAWFGGELVVPKANILVDKQPRWW